VTLTFIGNGNMAKALIKGLVGKYKIEVLGRNNTTLTELKNEIENISVKELSSNEDITNKNIILCIKPNSLHNLSLNLAGIANSLYSVLAGTTIQNLQNNIKAKAYIRTMPNLAASYLKSMTTITGDEILKDSAIDIFNSIGTTLWLNTQKELDIATGLAGSGPAFLALIAESLTDGAVYSGLKRKDAQVLTAGLFDGFASLIANEKASDIKDNVMSPGGTTAVGYAVLEKNGVRNAMIKAISKAYNKAIELGKK
jgi:pyrroline-5-carboxylate reductase